MHRFRPAAFVLSLTLLVGGAALAQAVGQPGSLPPPRPPGQAQAPSAAPPPTRTAPPQAQRPAPAQTQRPAQGQRPAGQGGQARQGQTPTVQRPAQPNRRPAAAAGAAAGAAAAGAAAATSRPPEPAQPPPPPQPSIGSVTGLALPRFAALRSDEVNMRVGPNTTFPIEWTFQRRDLPVQIIGEFQLWRRIRDVDGAEGWVHSSTLMGRRTVLVRPPEGVREVVLRRRAEEGGAAVARLRPGVIARIRECEAGSAWCEVQVAGHRGYLRRAEVWGVGPEEEVK
jgi:SH3-like domain-containing protein